MQDEPWKSYRGRTAHVAQVRSTAPASRAPPLGSSLVEQADDLACRYQPPTTFTHGHAQVPSPGGALEGVLMERTSQLGALVGARVVHGFTWRLIAGTDFGFARRSFSSINHYDVSDPDGAQSFGLVLTDTFQTVPIVEPSAGLEWVGDHVTVALVPRVEFLFGKTPTWAFTMPLTLSWSWYQ
jgi:hypothetical protein